MTGQVQKAEAIKQLQAMLGERASLSQSVRDHHGTDIMQATLMPPDAVAFPESTAEVAAIARLCTQFAVPMIPFGAGTSVEGHITAPQGGVCVDLSRMTRILAVNREDMDVTVEAGVTREALNAHLRDTGLFFPVDPGANATLGGMAATRASGTTTVRYGTMRDNVLALEVVLPDGQALRTGTRARKSSAGYDLTRLFVGSEGTLGFITALTLKLYGVPEATSAAVCSFDGVSGAVDTVIQAIQAGVPMARMELLDALAMQAINRYSHLSMQESPTLFLEFHGSAAAVKEQAETLQDIARENGGKAFQWAVNAEDRSRLWKARHDAALASLALRPGSRPLGTDVCVPISRLADCIRETQGDLAEVGLVAPLGGHVGDGNFHLMLLIERNDQRERAKAEQFSARLVRRTLAMGGTCTGEHGIGAGKMKYLKEEAGEEGIGAMRRIKAALDPQGLMNPGKVIGG